MNDDSYRKPPPSQPTSGPLSAWQRIGAHMRLAPLSVHVGALGLCILLSAHRIGWGGFLLAMLVGGFASIPAAIEGGRCGEEARLGGAVLGWNARRLRRYLWEQL